MSRRILALGGAGLALTIAQQLALAAEPAAAGEYAPPQTPWGEPDLRGTWPINHLISVPLVRPAEFGDRLYMTDEEYATKQAAIAARDERFQSGPIPQADAAGQTLRQTSLIVDPPNGQFPELTAYGKELQAGMRGSYHPTQTVFDQIDDFSSWDRCITRGMPVSMLPRNYNNGIRIFQSPGYVTLLIEMAHEARIIPTDGRAALAPEIKQWLGESRGRWEGNTLVVETTNFGHGTSIGLTSAGVPGSPGPLQPSTDGMKITERFTRTAADTIEFEMTIEDPAVLERGSYKVAYPMFLDNSYDIYEYACHEGNTTVQYYIETSRFERAKAAEAAE
jgi:hypothetical protein